MSKIFLIAFVLSIPFVSFSSEQDELPRGQDHNALIASPAQSPKTGNASGHHSNTDGFKIASVEPGSNLSQLNLQSGDIIQKINNKDISSLNDLMKYMGNPKSVKSIKLLRNNKEENFEFNIK